MRVLGAIESDYLKERLAFNLLFMCLKLQARARDVTSSSEFLPLTIRPFHTAAGCLGGSASRLFHIPRLPVGPSPLGFVAARTRSYAVINGRCRPRLTACTEWLGSGRRLR
jgi:hypothetical protein